MKGVKKFLQAVITEQVPHTGGVKVILALLAGLEYIYLLVIKIRNYLYDRQIISVAQLSCPVISVGNLTTGGTGKTPVVAKLARRLAARGKKVVIISRGYRAKAERPAVVSDGQKVLLNARQAGDEAYMLAQKLTQIPVVIGSDRYRAGQLAQKEFSPEIIILDDGFQHRRLDRDQDIVVVNGVQPFGFEHLLPRGLLREPLTSLARADQVIINHQDKIEEHRLQEIRDRIYAYNHQIQLTAAHYRSAGLYNPGSDQKSETKSLSDLKQKKVLAVAGIGNPGSFAQQLAELGARVEATAFFPDHYHYKKEDIQVLIRQAKNKDINWLVTTDKDMVKLAGQLQKMLVAHGLKLFALQIEVEFEEEIIDESLCSNTGPL